MNFKLNTCKAEYDKDPNIKIEDIQELMKWVQEVPEMPEVTEYMLIQIYYVCDYDIEKAKNLVKVLYTFKATTPELFTGQDYTPENECSFWDVNYSALLPRTTPAGHRMYYVGLKDYTTSKYDFQTSITTGIKVITAIMLEKGICPGYLFIFDMAGFGFGHFFSIKLPFIKNFFYFLQEAVPLKVSAIHVINTHAITEKMVLLVKPFISKETFDMLHFHSNMDDFYKMVSRECLPKDLGGTLPITREELTEETLAKVTIFHDEVNEELQKKVKNEPSCEEEKKYFWDVRRFF